MTTTRTNWITAGKIKLPTDIWTHLQHNNSCDQLRYETTPEKKKNHTLSSGFFLFFLPGAESLTGLSCWFKLLKFHLMLSSSELLKEQQQEN